MGKNAACHPNNRSRVAAALQLAVASSTSPLPDWVAQRAEGASAEQLDTWFDRVLDTATLAEVFGGH